MPTLSISLPDSLNQFVQQQLVERQFADASDYIRQLIQAEIEETEWKAWTKKQDSDGGGLEPWPESVHRRMAAQVDTIENLEEKLLEGLYSGEAESVDQAFWDDIDRQVERRLEQKRARTAMERVG